MPRPHPDPDPDGFWPSCDDQQPGVSIRPFRHADLAALLAHPDHDPDPGDTVSSGMPAPVLAMRVRASSGRPGASAHAEYRRRRAPEMAAWTHSLPWRIAAVLVVGLTAWLLATQIASHLAALAGVTVAAGLAWRLRFRSSPATVAWRRGAAGERRTARLLGSLERRGWAVLHDLAIPGTQANIDHLVIGPGGVLVVDSRQYRGRLWLDADGLLWHGRHQLVATLRKVRWAADQADEVLGVVDVQILAIMAVHGANVPWGQLTADGVIVAPARRVPDLLQALPAILGPERVAWLADRARLRFHAAARPPPQSALEMPLLSRLHRAGYLMRLTRSISGAPGALLSSDHIGSRVER
jgi:Nuclease-related domain